MEKRRSRGVTIASYGLISIGIIFSVVSFLLLFWAKPPSKAFFMLEKISAFYPFLNPIMPLPADSILCIIFGIRFLKLKNRYRRIFIIYQSIRIAILLFIMLGLFSTGIGFYRQPLAKSLLGAWYWFVSFIFLAAVYIYFLTRAEVKEQFK